MSAYRDRDAALRSRIGIARERIRALEASIAPEVFRYLQEDELRTFNTLRAAGYRALDSTEDLRGGATSADIEAWAGALEHFAEALQSLVWRIPSLEQVARAIAPQAPPISQSRRGRRLWVEPATNGLELEEFPTRLEKALEMFGASVARGGWAHSDRKLLPRVHWAVLQFGSTLVSNLLEIELPGGAPLFFTSFAVGVPRALPHVSVVPTTSVLPRLFADRRRFGGELRTGDDAFDGGFAVRSAEFEKVLTPIVRKKLLALSRYDVPTLTVEDGVATLRYTYDPQVPVLRAAIEVMLAVRDVHVAVRFAR